MEGLTVRILSVWDTAGVFVPIAKWLNEHGCEARILMRSEHDPHGQTRLSPYARMVDSYRDFIIAVIDEILTFRPTVIHVNYIYEELPLVRLIAPLTPIIYQYHGGDVRERIARGLPPHEETQLADKIIVSTDDLQAYGEWYDRPIPDTFYYRGGRVPGTALMNYVSYVIIDQRPLAARLCSERGLKLTILDRDEGPTVPYVGMPSFLSKFEYYLDFKGHIERTVLSKTALEALACGCKVIQDADLSKVITDATPYVRHNHPSDYAKLYARMKTSAVHFLRTVPVLVRYLLLTKRGLLFLRAAIGHGIPRLLRSCRTKTRRRSP